MLPMFIDSTSNKINRLVYRDGLLKSFGYDTAMVWVNTPLDLALDRIEKRERKVPEEFVRKVYKSMEENIDYYKSHFSLFLEVKNGDGEMTDEAVKDAYRKVSGFFKEEIKNPIGRKNREKAYKTSGYLTPYVFRSLADIKSKLINWY